MKKQVLSLLAKAAEKAAKASGFDHGSTLWSYQLPAPKNLKDFKEMK